MNVDFDNIFQHRIRIEEFQLKWRFTEEKYDKLPELHLEQLIPFNKDASKFLWDYIGNTNLHKDIPFKKVFFITIDKVKILDNNHKEKKWLYRRGFPFDKFIILP